MGKIDKEKMRSIGYMRPGYKSSKRREPVRNERTGEKGGTRTEHFSGRVDVNIQPKAVKIKTTTKEFD